MTVTIPDYRTGDTIEIDIRDDFAGPGGWDEGLRLLGVDESRVVGVEWDADACATAVAAGHQRIKGDVRRVDLVCRLLYIASPPCQSFSMAGKGGGRLAMAHLLRAVKWVADGLSPEDAVAKVHDEALDERSVLVLHPLAVIRDQRPRNVALEQVPAVRLVWEAYADVLRSWGYSVATGVLSSEQYGVPQTRKRAILIASLDREVALPTPTHSAYYPRDKGRLDDGVLPWVSMAQALSWGMTQRPSMTVTGGGSATGGAETFGNRARQAMQAEEEQGRWLFNGNQQRAARRHTSQPAPTVHFGHAANAVTWQDSGDLDPRDIAPLLPSPREAEEPRSALRMVKTMGAGMVERYGERAPREPGEPAFTITGGSGERYHWEPTEAVPGDTTWVEDRPSPTIVGSFAPDVVAAPGYRKPGDPPRQKTPGSVRVSVTEAGVLQSFPADYPWQGTKTKQYQQVGNAIPPLMAAAILRQVL